MSSSALTTALCAPCAVRAPTPGGVSAPPLDAVTGAGELGFPAAGFRMPAEEIGQVRRFTQGAYGLHPCVPRAATAAPAGDPRAKAPGAKALWAGPGHRPAGPIPGGRPAGTPRADRGTAPGLLSARSAR